MRSEQQIRERLERLVRENETIRHQAARHLLAPEGKEWRDGQAAIARLEANVATIRALEWALGGAA